MNVRHEFEEDDTGEELTLNPNLTYEIVQSFIDVDPEDSTGIVYTHRVKLARYQCPERTKTLATSESLIQNLTRFQDLETTRKEMLTDPDLVEMAEELAERFRVMVWSRDDDMEDRVIEMSEKYFEVLDKIDSGDPDVEQAIEESEKFTLDCLVTLLAPLVIQVINTGDWYEQ